MKVQTYLTASLLPESPGPSPALAVMIDVLRASTTICAALAAGAEAIIPVAELEEALRLARQFERSTVLLAGERKGEKPEGFDLGNSPLEYTSEVVAGKRIIFTTTNGTQVLHRLRFAPLVLVSGFVNVSATANAIAARVSQYAELHLCCAGTTGTLALEDALAAGALIDRLQSLLPQLTLTDASRAVLWLYQYNADRLADIVRTTDHARRLQSLGFGDDIAFATQLDTFAIVPVMDQHIIRRSEKNNQEIER